MRRTKFPHPKISLLVAFVAFCTVLQAQTINPNWNQEVNTALQEFLACQADGTQKPECSKFIGESLNLVYKVNDFYADKASKYMSASEISDFLKTSTQWKAIGQSYDQDVLKKAQEHANAKKAVVAVYRNAAGVGHVALITPGELQASGSWGLNVPNAVSFFQKEPTKSFVNKGLSYAFAKAMMKDVTIYIREY